MLTISVEQTYLLTVAVTAIVSLLLWRAFKNLEEKNLNLEVAINEKIKFLNLLYPKEMIILEEKNKYLEEKNKFLNLLFFIDTFVNRTVSDSSNQDYSHALTYCKVLSPQDILSTAKITLIPQLVNPSLSKMKRAINAIARDVTKTEANGIHPIVLGIVNSCFSNSLNCDLSIRYETNMFTHESVVKRPDIILVKNDSNSRAMSDIIIPIEIKLDNNVERGIAQALGYTLSIIRDRFEITDSDQAISGVCVATDGHLMSLGYVHVQNYKCTIMYTGNKKIVLWPRLGERTQYA